MREPYTVEFAHGASVYMTIPSSQRNGHASHHYLSPGQYMLRATYQGPESLHIQFYSDAQETFGATVVPSGTVADARTGQVIPVVVKTGATAYIRCFTTPRTSDLTNPLGVASVHIIPRQVYDPA